MIEGNYKHVDIHQLNEMADGNSAFISNLIQMFFRQIPSFSEQLDSLLQQGNYYAIGKLAHKIKGSASMVGVTSLVGPMRELESWAKQGVDSERCLKLISEFKNISGEAIDELTLILNDLD